VRNFSRPRPSFEKAYQRVQILEPENVVYNQFALPPADIFVLSVYDRIELVEPIGIWQQEVLKIVSEGLEALYVLQSAIVQGRIGVASAAQKLIEIARSHGLRTIGISVASAKNAGSLSW
jgi:hypothetical protein